MTDAPRPPYVVFETRAVEDRTASLESGHYVPKDIDYAIVTPAGTRDRLEKPVEDWFLSLEEGVKQDRIPSEWLDAYRRKYDAFKNAREDPESGTSIRDWSALSPAQSRLLLDIGIRTIEDVAAMTEEACGRFGMGARAIRAKAQAWLDSSSNTGKVAAEIEALRQRNTELETRDEERQRKMEELSQRLQALEASRDANSMQPEEPISDEVED